MFRILINALVISALTCWPLFAKEYSGSAWVSDACKYYNGSSWVDCTKKRYTGSAWESIEVAAGGSDLIDEDFSGTTIPSGWTVQQGSADWSNAGYVELAASTQSEVSAPAISTTSKVYCAFKFKIAVLDNTGDTRLIYGRDSTNANAFYVAVRATDVLRAYHGTANASSSAISADTYYYMWLDYEKGTGANGTLTVRYGTTGAYSSATIFATITTGTATTDLADLRIAHDVNATSGAVTFSYVKVSESAIGDIIDAD